MENLNHLMVCIKMMVQLTRFENLDNVVDSISLMDCMDIHARDAWLCMYIYTYAYIQAYEYENTYTYTSEHMHM